VPFSVETYGRLGKLTVAFLGMVGGDAMAGGDVIKFGLVAAALREFGVVLCEGNPLHAYNVQYAPHFTSSSLHKRYMVSVLQAFKSYKLGCSNDLHN
jgi:hypothetical protein